LKAVQPGRDVPEGASRGAADDAFEDGSAASASDALELRLLAITAAARFHGVELDRDNLRYAHGEQPSPAALVQWVRDAGMWARAVRMRWSQLLKLEGGSPVVLLFSDGSGGLMVTADPARNVIWVKDPRGASSDPPVAVDELRLSQVWAGEVLLLRAARGESDDEAQLTIGWLARLVGRERKSLIDIFVASFTLSVLTIIPPLVVMTILNTVLTHHAVATLVLCAVFLGVVLVYDTLLSFARRLLVLYVGARVDARINLTIFRRLLSLRLDYFERSQAGVTIGNVSQIYKVREFLVGKLLSTMLDMVTLLVLLPVLFIIEPTLSWMVVACGGLIGVIIAVFIRPIGKLTARYIRAENARNSVMYESIAGIKTVKSLALEPQQRELWDQRVATAVQARLDLGLLSNWPATLVHPIEAFMTRGVVLVGAALAISGGSGINTGALMAFMMLSSRVSQPLVGLAKILEDLEEVRTAIGVSGSVLNQPPESRRPGAGLRPRFAGAISFNNVMYAYPNATTRALDGVTFDIPPGTMLGLVGRSGSGKSTVTRLLQGISRDYEGFIKIDGDDLREINLAHMRRNFGVVLQENFLFRGTIRENILAGRPGLTLTDAVRAARLAGAEEFIERMPNGYETWIEEGSPNLSGGQRQRLAIARALIHDPKILILDEATSALDPESEALVNANLQRIAKGRTMVIVSHRLSSLTDCDQILVLDKGKMVDMAPHVVLVERCSIYRQLWLQQNRHMEQTGPRPATTPPALAQGT
jgi:HlyB family type I secretion system ABC transporter